MSPRTAACLLLTALAPATLCAQQYSAFPVPSNAYPGDRILVPLLGGGDCNAARLDPARPPQIQLLRRYVNEAPHLDVYEYQVHYWLVNLPDVACGTPPPPGYLLADVGPLPLGLHRFDVSGQLLGQPHASYTTPHSWVQRHAHFPGDAAGLWYDPAQSGRGLSLTRVSADRLALLWFMHDAQGGTDWVVATIDKLANEPRGSGAAFNTRGAPLASGPAALTPQPWGTVEFDYQGCGRARLTWTPLDPALPPGSQSLQKLTQDVAIEDCAPEAQATAIWTDR